MKKGNLAGSAAQKTKDANDSKKKEAMDKAMKGRDSKQYENYEIAIQIMKAKKKNEEAFPSKDIETLVELAYKVVAAHFELYPELDGVSDTGVQEEVSALSDLTTFRS
jgi:hypothetical protein